MSRHTVLYGLRLHYLESTGTPDHPDASPILLIAGWPMAGFMLIPLARILASQRRCYILDLPGYGGSQVHERSFCGFDYHLKFVRAFHEKVIPHPQVVVFGYSTGGVHGIHYASKYPDRVDRLISFSAPYDGTVQFAEMARRSPKRFKTLHVLYPFMTKRPKLIKIMNYRLVKFFSMGVFFLAVYVRLYPHAIRKCDKKFMLHFFNRTSKFNVKTIFDLAMDLSRTDYSHKASSLKVPTLIMAGAKDTTVRPQRSKRLAALIPSSQLHILEGADHSVGIVEPERVAPVVLSFLNAPFAQDIPSA